MFFLNPHQKTNHLNELVVVRSSIMNSQTKFKNNDKKPATSGVGTSKVTLESVSSPTKTETKGLVR